MARLAILNAAGDVVDAVILGEKTDFPNAVLIPDNLPVGPGTLYADGAFDVDPVEPTAPPPLQISRMEFVTLVQSAGGMTDEMLVAAHGNPMLAALWLKLQLAAVVVRDDPATRQGLEAMAALGHIPNGAQAVLDAWPTQG